MEILRQLSSQVGDSNGNYQVASECLKDKLLIQEIVAGLKNNDNKIVIDCIEVLTEIAKEQPTWVVPYGQLLPEILGNKNNRARWEAMHCLALIAEYTPPVIKLMIDQLETIVEEDKSVIVRDYAVDTIGNYAKTSEGAAQTAYPILERAAKVWEGRHAKQALNGLSNVVTVLPEKKEQIREIAEENLDHQKGTVKSSAQKLLRLIEKM